MSETLQNNYTPQHDLQSLIHELSGANVGVEPEVSDVQTDIVTVTESMYELLGDSDMGARSFANLALFRTIVQNPSSSRSGSGPTRYGYVYELYNSATNGLVAPVGGLDLRQNHVGGGDFILLGAQHVTNSAAQYDKKGQLNSCRDETVIEDAVIDLNDLIAEGALRLLPHTGVKIAR